jgi:hypothetical protein
MKSPTVMGRYKVLGLTFDLFKVSYRKIGKKKTIVKEQQVLKVQNFSFLFILLPISFSDTNPYYFL